MLQIHNITALFDRFSDKLSEDVFVEEKTIYLFNFLTAHYLNNRYAVYKRNLAAASNKKEAGRILKESKEAFKWLLTLKP